MQIHIKELLSVNLSTIGSLSVKFNERRCRLDLVGGITLTSGQVSIKKLKREVLSTISYISTFFIIIQIRNFMVSPCRSCNVLQNAMQFTTMKCNKTF